MRPTQTKRCLKSMIWLVLLMLIGSSKIYGAAQEQQKLESTVTPTTDHIISTTEASGETTSTPSTPTTTTSTTSFTTSNDGTTFITEKSYTEIPEIITKTSSELKKKIFVDQIKSKPEQKYPKLSVKQEFSTKPTYNDADSTTTNPTTTSKSGIFELPLLVRGEPVAIFPTMVVSTTDFSTVTENEHTDTTMAGYASSEMASTSTQPTTMITTMVTEMRPIPKGRALNISASDLNNNLHSNATDLSDVSMDEEDKEIEGGEYIAAHNGSAANMTPVKPLPTVTSLSICIDGNKTYSIGEKIKRGCDEQCVCEAGGKITNCEPVCQKPLFKLDMKIKDPLCHVSRDFTENPCCGILVCADLATEPEESCIFGNTTVARGQKVEDGCSKTCICEAGGHLKCQPRCPPNDTTPGISQHDRCVVLKDPRDNCCTITLCDVTLGDHEVKAESPTDLSVNLTDVKVLNSTAIQLKLSSESFDDVTIEISENNHVWRQVKPTKDGVIADLQPAHGYYVRVLEGSRAGPSIHVSLLAEVIKQGVTDSGNGTDEDGVCIHRGKSHKIGEEWYDDCIALCQCNETAQIECITIECPTDFGLDVLDRNCIDWETVPPNHVPKAPNCCPQEVRCRSNGSCSYEGVVYDNWSEIPSNVTGCEKNCFCEFGKVSCSPACPPVSETPPAHLNCRGQEPILAHLPGDECCTHWICDVSSTTSGKNSTQQVYPTMGSNSMLPTHKPESSKPGQAVSPGSSFSWPMATHPAQPASPPGSDVLHYPMDPGHPTMPYMGPYNPDYRPTEPSLDDVFHLSGHSHSDKSSAPTKEKSKSKSDSKKPFDGYKPSKDSSDQFPGPLAPDRFTEKPIPSRPVVPIKPNKLPGSGKPSSSSSSSDSIEQPQFIPLDERDQDFTPNNGQNIPQTHFETLLENQAAGPPYDPNNILPSAPKKKLPGSGIYSGDKGKPQKQIPPRDHEVVPDELYHLINVHPGQFGQGVHPGIYDINQEIAGGAHSDKIHQQVQQQQQPQGLPPHLPPNYFGPPKKGGAHVKPQIFAQKDENGQTTYHLHTPEVPSSPQQIEELLAHIAQHDPSGNLFLQQQHQQQYPGVQPQPPPRGFEQVQPGGLPPHYGPHGFVPQGYEQGSSPDTQAPTVLGPDDSNQQVYEVVIEELRPINMNTVRLMFSVPSALVNLHGRVEVRYTSDKSNGDPSTWKSQIFTLPGDLIGTKELEFDLGGLKPWTSYKLMILVKLRDISIMPASKIYQVRTLDKPEPTEISVDPELRVVEVNSTVAELEWREFTAYELQFIDGIYLTYKAHGDGQFSETPLLHKSVNSYVLENLRSSTTYEVHFSTKDVMGQTNILINSKTVNFTTDAETDPYSFDVEVEIKSIKPTEVEVLCSGVPHPQDKYVNIYRAVYQTDSGKEETSTFKITKKESQARTTLSDLKPATRYRLWIELYLTNGKIKKSIVKTFMTKSGSLPPAGASQQQGKFAASVPYHEGDYYGPLVVVAIVASLAILSTLILLMMLMKRRVSSKADISPRKTTSAYDNPSYKVELQQETMDL